MHQGKLLVLLLLYWNNLKNVIRKVCLYIQLMRPLLIGRYACDLSVLRLLRQRGLGNSSTRLYKQLTEQHSEFWHQQVLHYLTDCQGFKKANASRLVTSPAFQDPPTLQAVPKPAWLLTVYCNEVLQRLEEVKASITSTFGTVLKIDSTRKVCFHFPHDPTLACFSHQETNNANETDTRMGHHFKH